MYSAHLVSLFYIWLSVNAASTSKKPSAVLPLQAAAYGTTYDVTIDIGGNSYTVLPDTGSSDLWLLEPGWKCYLGSPTVLGKEVSQSMCLAGNDTYSQNSTYSPITNAWIGEHYGAGNVQGTLGYEDVRIGNISISRQEMGFVNATTGAFDGLYVGIMGLGYQPLSQIHPKNYTTCSATGYLQDRLMYPTIVERMMRTGMEPYFAFAMERTPMQQEKGDGGYVSFGTLPPVTHGDWVTAPVEISKGIPASFTNGTKKLTEWTLTVEATQWGSQTDDTKFQAVVDTGNWMNIFPPKVATAINSKFDPPAGDFDDSGYYPVNCNATPPSDFGVQINGHMFSVDARDMIWRDWDGKCYSTVGTIFPEGSILLYFLGDAFLKNVVAVFDFGKDEMRFAQRLAENSTSPAPASTGDAALPAFSCLSLALALVVAVFA